MKKQNQPISPSLITAKEYAALSPEEREEWRAVHPRHERLPKWCFVCYGIAALALCIYLAARIFPAFADLFNQNVSEIFRRTLAALTGWIPFSLGEALILLLPVIFGLAVWYAAKYRCDTWRSTWSFVGILIAVICMLLSMFVFTFATGYHGTTLDKKLGLAQKEVSAEELYQTALILAEKVNEEHESMTYAKNGFSVMPYSLSEMNDKLLDAYDVFCAKHKFIDHYDSRLKPVMLSELMNYTHITGVYSYFTGEANIDIAFPDYTIPYTAAHELAHQRGIAREDEANMVAFLVCMESDDAYIRYCAYLNMYEYVANALYRASPELYAKASGKLHADVKSEMVAYSNFFAKYQNSTAGSVSGAVNDTFLKFQGTEGTASYGMVVDLTVAYYKHLGMITE
ncbi:MAG: DUF3810 domain-containing protein [Clostridia bacterium]|nr:DUF3810 domain-containing protein [Clostridia bacterium]